MATVADLLVRISADSSGLRKELNAAKRQIKESFGTEALKLSKKAQTSLKYIAAGMAGVVSASVIMSAKMDMTKRAFETLTGSVEKAQQHLDELEKFGATTPFEFTGLTEASKKMQAYGFDVQAVIPVLTVLGDAAMAVGLGQEGIDRVTLAIGQMNAKGKVSAEEMRQLAETGLPVWDILASKLGITTAKAMDMSRKGAISAKEGITAILTGLEDRFGGMMDKVAGEIPQSFSNMKDSVSSIMRTLGSNITEAFDLKAKFKGAADWLGDFATVAKKAGIKEAFEQMVPESVKTAIVGVSGVIIGIAVPAFAMLAGSVIAATWPLLSIGAIIGLAAVAIYKNWFGVGSFFKALWTGIVNIFVWAKDLISGIVEKIGAMASWVTDKISVLKSFLGFKTEVAETNKELEKTSEKAVSLKDILSGTLKDSGLSDEAGAKAAAAALKKQQKEYEALVEKAKAASDRIEDEWIRLTKTQMDVLDKWYRDEISTLNESKTVNENYQRDITRLNETYAEKRRKILHDEARERQETFKSISDGWISMQKELTLGGLKGSAADLFSMNASAADQGKEIFDYFDEISARYTSATAAQKKNILDSLNAMGIQYKVTTEDMLDFAAEKETASAEKWKQIQDDKLDYYRQCKDIQAEIDEAYNQASLTRLQEVLTEEQALRLNNYEAMQEMMSTWQEAFLAAHSTVAQLMGDIYSSAFNGLSNNISDLIMGTKSLSEAWQDFGKTIVRVIADYFARKIAGMLMENIMGKSAIAAQTAASITAAASTAAAWAPAAAAVSLASFGANSAPAMAGISATHALSQGLSIVPFAEGGYVTGPTLAMIGEGRFKESVVQDSNVAYKKIASGINRNNGSQDSARPVNIHINTNDAKSFRDWLEDGGGRELEKYLTRRGRSFAVAGGF
jgi:tape measure domain-containing protein